MPLFASEKSASTMIPINFQGEFFCAKNFVYSAQVLGRHKMWDVPQLVWQQCRKCDNYWVLLTGEIVARATIGSCRPPVRW